MKSSPRPQSATSLPRSPHDDASSRSTKYLVMMGIRVVCFVLMVLITPYGWYTWVLGAGAVFLPYIAVVIANVGQDGREARAQQPEKALSATPGAPPAGDGSVLRLDESPPDSDEPDGATR